MHPYLFDRKSKRFKKYILLYTIWLNLGNAVSNEGPPDDWKLVYSEVIEAEKDFWMNLEEKHSSYLFSTSWTYSFDFPKVIVFQIPCLFKKKTVFWKWKFIEVENTRCRFYWTRFISGISMERNFLFLNTLISWRKIRVSFCWTITSV